MMLKIFWSPLAVERLEEIFDYISAENRDAAYKLVNKIIDKFESLSEFPERGRKVPEINKKDYREVFEGEYRLIYRILPDRIFVLTIRNFK